MKILKKELIYFATALMFFTRIPVPFTIPYSGEIMNKSQKYFAWVGMLVGLINTVVLYFSAQLFNLEIWNCPHDDHQCFADRSLSRRRFYRYV